MNVLVKRNPLWVLCAMVIAMPAVAQEPDGTNVAPKGIDAGGFRVFPEAGLELKHNDNLFKDSANVSSTIEVLTAGVKAIARKDYNQFTAGYNTELGWYNNSSADNYDEHNVDLRWQSRPSVKLQFDLDGYWHRQHDDRGSDDTAIAASPNEYDKYGLGGTVIYGAETAKGRIEGRFSYSDQEYQNNRATTQSLDVVSSNVGGTFYWNMAPKTSALAEVNYTEDDYQLASTLRDSELVEYLVGVKWKATAQTSGTIKVGHAQRDFDSATRQDFSGSSWQVGVTWSPLRYSTFNLVTSRKPNNATGGADDYIVNTDTSLTRSHIWKSYLRSDAKISYSVGDYQNALNREDDTVGLEFGLTYDLSRNMALSAGYEYTDRDSNIDTNDYERNLLSVGINWKI